MTHHTICAAIVSFYISIVIATTRGKKIGGDLFLFLHLYFTACEEEALFAVEDTFEGVVISTFHSASVPPRSQELQRLILQGHHLSEECGNQFVRCQNLLRETFHAGGVQQTVVLVPLVEGLAVVGVSRGANAIFHIALHTILQTSGTPITDINCSPSSAYKILDGYFAVCTNQTTNFVSVFEIHLNKSFLPSTGITYPTNQLTIPPYVGSIANASNFVHVEIDRNHEYIIFAVGTVIYFMRPFLYAAGPLGNSIPSETCERVHTLVHQQEAVLYAYCTEHIFTYDIGDENWLVQDTFARRGIPYPCPKQETGLSVFADYIQYTTNGQVEEVEIQGDAYSSGVCFGNATQSYFAFRDKNLGDFSLDLSTAELVLVTSSSCQDDCYPLSAVDSRYLIVREDATRTVLVLDYLGERLRLIEALHASAALATVVSLECLTEDPVITGSTGDITTGAGGITTRGAEDTTTRVATTYQADTFSSGTEAATHTPPSIVVSVQPGGESDFHKNETLMMVVTTVVIPTAVVVLVASAIVGGVILLIMLCRNKIRKNAPE